MKKRYVLYVILFLLSLAIKFLVSKFTSQEFTWWPTIAMSLGGILTYEIIDSNPKKK